MPKPNDDALRLARLNLRTRLQRLATRTTTMPLETIELFHDQLDEIAHEVRYGKAAQHD